MLIIYISALTSSFSSTLPCALINGTLAQIIIVHRK